jgi:putative transposase
MSLHLKKEGSFASRHKIRRLMRIMGIRAIYQKPSTSKKNNQHNMGVLKSKRGFGKMRRR